MDSLIEYLQSKGFELTERFQDYFANLELKAENKLENLTVKLRKNSKIEISFFCAKGLQPFNGGQSFLFHVETVRIEEKLNKFFDEKLQAAQLEVLRLTKCKTQDDVRHEAFKESVNRVAKECGSVPNIFNNSYATILTNEFTVESRSNFGKFDLTFKNLTEERILKILTLLKDN